MEKLDPKVDGSSMDIIKNNIEKLKSIFPDVFNEEKVDIEKLKERLGEFVDAKSERYNFTWHGKSQAKRLAQQPSTGTLRPCKEESTDWDTTENLYIEGDNLEVLKLLQKSYHNKVKMIYIDPPYNTGNDFVYRDNYKDNLKNYLEITGQVDDDGNKLSTNSDTSGRYHTDWLNMMYSRLKLARNLLKENGVIFISIDDNEVANLRKICDEIFGEDNFVADFPRVTKKAGKSSEQVSKNNDYILCYGKSNELLLNAFEHNDDGFKYSDEYEDTRGNYKLNQTLDYGSIQYSPSLDYEIEIEGQTLRPGNVTYEEMEERKRRNPKSDFCWRWSKELYEFGLKNGFIVLKHSSNGYRIYTKTYQNAKILKNSNNEYVVEIRKRTKPVTTLHFIANKFSNDNSKKDLMKIFENNIFDYSKPIELIRTLIFLGTSNDDIILDFFSGSSTTAHAVMQQNINDKGKRKFIMVQLQEPTDKKSDAYKAGYKYITDIGKERIRRAGEKIKEVNKGEDGIENLDTGFKVFKLDTSNIKTWDTSLDDDLKQTLFNMVENIKEDRTEEDIVYEILLKYGLDLTIPIEETTLNNKKVYIVGYGSLIICLDKNITLDIVEEIGNLRDKYQPEIMRVIFKDNGFKDDVIKTNAIQILKKYGIEDVKSL